MADTNNNTVITLDGLQYFYNKLKNEYFYPRAVADGLFASVEGNASNEFNALSLKLYDQAVPGSDVTLMLRHARGTSGDPMLTLVCNDFEGAQFNIPITGGTLESAQNKADKIVVEVDSTHHYDFLITQNINAFTGFSSFNRDGQPDNYSVGDIIAFYNENSVVNPVVNPNAFAPYNNGAGFYFITAVSREIDGYVPQSAVKICGFSSTGLYYCKTDGKFYVKSLTANSNTLVDVTPAGGGSIGGDDYDVATNADIDRILTGIVGALPSSDDDDEGGDDNEGTGGDDNTGTENTGGDDNNGDNNTETT